MANVIAYAKIQVTVEVEMPAVYDGNWTLGAVQEQVASEALAMVQMALPKGVCVVGAPTVIDIVIRRKGA